MSDAQQTVSFQVDVGATIEARMVRGDYGVPGSPVWYDAEDHDFADLVIDIAGVNVAVKALPKELHDAILDIAAEECDDRKWEAYE